VTSLAEKIVATHDALRGAEIEHAFGGALALAWCTQRARGTIDIDVNIFVPAAEAGATFARLPPEVRWSDVDVETAERDGQVRLWWDDTPVDVFLNTTPFHEQVATRARWEIFLGRPVPFLACRDLAVFKVFFDRTKDWADLEEMAAADALDVEAVLGVTVRYLGADHRVERLRALADR
jgi:hypothetical protein